ncbi:hypothetical protein SAMN06272781_0764 [Streptomyces sp. 1222.2]|nr:hypothetical protein SAMN06272781_0764 [Streptomyces sp. 1222.2]
MLLDEVAYLYDGESVPRRDPAHLEVGVPRGDVRVRPKPEEVTASGGTSDGRTGWPGTELSLTTAALASFTAWTSRRLSAERLVAPERMSLYRVLTVLTPRPPAGRPWNHLRSGSGVFWPFFSGSSYDCPMSEEPTTRPVWS